MNNIRESTWSPISAWSEDWALALNKYKYLLACEYLQLPLVIENIFLGVALKLRKPIPYGLSNLFQPRGAVSATDPPPLRTPLFRYFYFVIIHFFRNLNDQKKKFELYYEILCNDYGFVWTLSRTILTHEEDTPNRAGGRPIDFPLFKGQIIIEKKVTKANFEKLKMIPYKKNLRKTQWKVHFLESRSNFSFSIYDFLFPRKTHSKTRNFFPSFFLASLLLSLPLSPYFNLIIKVRYDLIYDYDMHNTVRVVNKICQITSLNSFGLHLDFIKRFRPW